MERQASPPPVGDRLPRKADSGPPEAPGAADPAAPVVDEEGEVPSESLWVALLIGIALLLSLCVVLTLVAASRAPVGAPG